MRSLASVPSRSSGKTGSPPAISTSSSTQRMPRNQRIVPFLEVHARPAGQTLPRRPGPLAGPAAARSASASAFGGAADDAAEHPNHLQDLVDAALIEGEHRVAALDQLGGDVGLQVGERQHEIGVAAPRSCRSARGGTTRHAASAAPRAAAPCSPRRRPRGRLRRAGTASRWSLRSGRRCGWGYGASDRQRYERPRQHEPARSTVSPVSTGSDARTSDRPRRTCETRRSRRTDRPPAAGRRAAPRRTRGRQTRRRASADRRRLSRARRPPSIISSASSARRFGLPQRKHRRQPGARQPVFAVPAHVLEEQIAERDVREPVGHEPRHRGAPSRPRSRRSSTAMADRHGAQREAGGLGLGLEHVAADGVHRHAIERFVEGGQQSVHAARVLLPQRVQRPRRSLPVDQLTTIFIAGGRAPSQCDHA